MMDQQSQICYSLMSNNITNYEYYSTSASLQFIFSFTLEETLLPISACDFSNELSGKIILNFEIDAKKDVGKTGD